MKQNSNDLTRITRSQWVSYLHERTEHYFDDYYAKTMTDFSKYIFVFTVLNVSFVFFSLFHSIIGLVNSIGSCILINVVGFFIIYYTHQNSKYRRDIEIQKYRELNDDYIHKILNGYYKGNTSSTQIYKDYSKDLIDRFLKPYIPRKNWRNYLPSWHPEFQKSETK